jgi:hypothetical protein
MQQITGITSDAYQQQTITLPSGLQMVMRMRFIPQQYGWFFEQITAGSVTINGIRICTVPNILRQWKNILDFGIACKTDGNREPTQLEDFSNGYSILYLLDSDDVEEYESYLKNQ